MEALYFLAGLILGVLFGGAVCRSNLNDLLRASLRDTVKELKQGEFFTLECSVGRHTVDEEDDDEGGESFLPLSPQLQDWKHN